VKLSQFVIGDSSQLSARAAEPMASTSSEPFVVTTSLPDTATVTMSLPSAATLTTTLLPDTRAVPTPPAATATSLKGHCFVLVSGYVC